MRADLLWFHGIDFRGRRRNRASVSSRSINGRHHRKSSDTGKLEQVRIGSGQETAVKLDSANVSAVKYEIDGTSKYTVWLDERGVPVKFIVDDDTGKVTFTLAKCVGCNAEISQLVKR